MAEIMRVTPKEIYPRVKARTSLLVCAYESEETCRSMLLEGGMTQSDFKARVGQVPKDQEIIFYCA